MKLFSKQSLPITIVIGFNLFTLFIFFTAPIQWKTNNLLIFTLFVLFCQLLIFIGFKTGYKKGYRKSENPVLKRNILNELSNKSLSFIFIFYSLTFLIKYAYLLRFNPLDIKGMFQFLMIGVIDPHLGYSLTADSLKPTTISWTVYFLISIINQLFFIIGFVCWEKYNKWKKILFIFFLSIEIFFWVGRATNSGIIFLITTFLLSQLYRMEFKKAKRPKIVKPILIILFSLIVSISVFSYTLLSRKGSSTLDYQQFNLENSTVDENSEVFSVLPKPLHDTYMYVVYYFAQGYYHTCLAFDLDFEPTYFLGNNPAIISLAQTFGIDVWKNTYIYRLKEKGVDPLIQWHSAYSWYASDVSFFGVPFLLFLIAYLFGFSWAFSSNRNDFLSKIMFIILGNMLLYLFANNSYLSSVFYSFMFISAIWYFTRIKNISIKAS
jgi:hypothetical protein